MRRIAVFVFALLLASPAMAAPAIDKAGADALKPFVAATITHFEGVFKEYGMTLKKQGELIVEPAGSYYAITTPSFTLDMGSNITRNIGMLAINAIPTDTPDILKIAMALPTPITDKAADGTVVGNITIGKQTMNGLWHMKAMDFVQLDASYQNVHSIDPFDKSDIVIPALTAKRNMTNLSGNIWSGATDLAATNPKYTSSKGTITASDFHMRMNVDKQDIMAKEVPNPDAPKTVSPSESPQLAMKLLMGPMINKFSDATNTALTFNNVQIKKPSFTGTAKSVVINNTIDGPRDTASNSTWNVAIDGVTTADPALVQVTPTRFLLKGSTKSIAMGEALQAKSKASATSSLMKPGSGLVIDSLVLDAPAYGLTANANFQAPASPEARPTGNLNLTARGLNEMLTAMTGPNAPKMGDKPLIGPQITNILAMVQMTGKQSNDEQGRPVLTYEIKFGADGKVLLNGADLSAAMQSLKGANTNGAVKTNTVKAK